MGAFKDIRVYAEADAELLSYPAAVQYSLTVNSSCAFFSVNVFGTAGVTGMHPTCMLGYLRAFFLSASTCNLLYSNGCMPVCMHACFVYAFSPYSIVQQQ